MSLKVDVDDGVAHIVFDSPPINLFTIGLFVETAGVIERLASDDQVRVVVLSSAVPDFFIAHFYVEAILSFPVDQPPATELNLYHRMCETLRTMPKATIAVIEGRVGGGGSELALSCDMRFASHETGSHRGAVFNQPEVALGIIPGGSGTQRLSRLIGRSRALEVVLGCGDIDARTACDWGWVNRTFDPTDLRPFVDRLARRIASFPPHAVAAAKRAILLNERNMHTDLLVEAGEFSATLGEPGTREAMTRFMERGGQTLAGELRLEELFDLEN
ncbi:MAG: enoyl-CoA hydratase/isomerase family protein [Actinomycetota bacterium]